MNAFAPLLVGQTHDRRGFNAVVFHQRLLHIPRVHVKAATDNHVFEPVDDEKKPCVIHKPHITGMQPARPQCQSTGLGALPISLQHAGPAHHDFTHLARG